MRMGAIGTSVTLAITLCVCLNGEPAWAENTPAPAAPKPTQRQLTEAEKTIVMKIILDTSAEPDDGPAPLTVNFSAKPYDDEEAVKATYVWDFGDGSPKVRKQNPTHTYKKPGAYKATVKVTNKAGQVGIDEFPINVEEPERR